MTKETMREGVFDRELGDALRGAYDAMDPSPEQEQRMLAALLAAQDEAAFRETVEDPEQPERPESPAPKRAKPRLAWKLALPLAACFVVGAVVFGVAQNGNTADIQEAAQVEEAASAQPDYALDIRAGGIKTQSTNGADESVYAESTSEDALMAAVPDSAMVDEGEVAPAESGAQPKLNTEEYKALDETGFVSTLSSPLSTVSADVDTASYCNLRRMINDGLTLQDVPSGAVRIEEMLNYFDYGYATDARDGTAKDALFGMQAQSAVCPWNKDTQLLVLGFATPPETKAAEKGSNLVFLVDVSGSMDSPDKLDLLQDSFATLLESLGAKDRVSIVTYASGEEVVLEGASGDDDKAILKAIYRLRANGATNGEAGLQKAYDVAQRNFIEGGVNRIVMASDGDLNVGITSESDLYDFVDAKRDSGIYLSVLGFGSGNYKDNKMETLADHGNGSYHYIDCAEEAEHVLKTKLTSNIVPFADNVKVQVEFNPAQVKAYRLIGYENRELADADFRDDAVDAGDVGPGAQFTLAYEVVLADSAFEVDEPELKYGGKTSFDDASDDWLTCSLRYRAFEDDQMHEQDLEVGPSAIMATPSADWKLAAAVIEFGMLARGSDYAGTSSEQGILGLLDGAEANDQTASFKRLVLSAGLE